MGTAGKNGFHTVGPSRCNHLSQPAFNLHFGDEVSDVRLLGDHGNQLWSVTSRDMLSGPYGALGQQLTRGAA